MKEKLIFLVSAGLMFALFLNGCTTDQLANIENPTDLSKEVKIDVSKLDISFVDVEELRKRLAMKPTIPSQRESSELKDPFIIKSLKALRVKPVIEEQEEKVKKEEEGKGIQKITETEKKGEMKSSEGQKSAINIAEESPMMFNFEGLSVSEGSRRAILRHLVNNKTYIVKKGDIVGGYSIIDITDDSLILVKGNEKLVISKKKK